LYRPAALEFLSVFELDYFPLITMFSAYAAPLIYAMMNIISATGIVFANKSGMFYWSTGLCLEIATLPQSFIRSF
jgi:hypothetical protein